MRIQCRASFVMPRGPPSTRPHNIRVPNACFRVGLMIRGNKQPQFRKPWLSEFGTLLLVFCLFRPIYFAFMVKNAACRGFRVWFLCMFSAFVLYWPQSGPPGGLWLLSDVWFFLEKCVSVFPIPRKNGLTWIKQTNKQTNCYYYFYHISSFSLYIFQIFNNLLENQCAERAYVCFS